MFKNLAENKNQKVLQQIPLPTQLYAGETWSLHIIKWNKLK